MFNDYFGKEQYEKYHDIVSDALSGRTVSKAIADANYFGGLMYEANKLNIDMWDLLACLEGMCYNGEAREINDSTYLVM